ncbi:trigger factor [uncultured Sphingomonas sp.]|uniref:trigger factor n=1 Tax=uncultured Sphingomonas sp. TaxID=158754 RepID=UPI0035CAA845
MQTVETLNEGLRRAYRLTITARDVEGRVAAEVKRVAPQVKMPGFRPGKVPANLVRKMHGPAMLQEALNGSIQDGVQSLIAEHGLRPATQPSIELEGDYAPGQDAAVKVELEVLPDVPAPAIEGLVLERLTVPAEEATVDEQLQRFADGQKSWTDAAEGHAAAMGDTVVMDFVGKTADGVAFPGGTGEDMSVELGAGRLIPGFEDQVVGATVGEERRIAVTFPEDYQEKSLAGKDATFDLTIKAVKTAGEGAIDDGLAKNLGLESLEQLRGLVKGQVEQELNGLTRTHMKRKLLDQLAEGHDFPVPPSMVEAEFAQIWQQLEHEATHEADAEKAKAEMEGDREDYRRIAERRVRLGLLLSEIGQANGIEVNQQEMNRLIAQASQQYRPEDRQKFAQYIGQDPMAAAQLRAPLYEDKVVDFLFAKAEITEREVTRAELEAAIESEDGFATGTHMHDHGDHAHDHDDHDGHDHDHGDHDHTAHDHAAHDAAPAEAETAADEAPAATKPVAMSTGAIGAEVEAPAKKPRAKKAAADGDTPAATLTDEPAATPNDEPAAKKPRARKKADG